MLVSQQLNSLRESVAAKFGMDEELSKEFNEAITNAETNEQSLARYDKLGEEIGDFYETYNDETNEEIPAKKQGDLGDIGEVAAKHFRYL